MKCFSIRKVNQFETERESFLQQKRFSALKERLRVRITLNFVNALIESNTKVLDLGTGRGGLAKGLRSSSIVGVDVNLEDLKLNKLATKVRASATSLPFQNECFDICLFTEVIEHLSDPGRAVQEIYRVSYRLVVSTPNNCLLRKILWKFRGKKQSAPYPYHFKEYSWKEVKSIVESSGYKLKRFAGMGFVINRPIFLAYRLGKLFPKLSAKILMEFNRCC